MKTFLESLLGWSLPLKLGRQRIALMYHSVVADDDAAAGQDWLHLPISQFRRQLDWLARHFTVVSPTRFFDPTPTAKPALLITFDDGYANNLQVAYPELSARALSALFFLSPGYLGGEMFWWDRLRLALGASGVLAQASDYQRFKQLHPFELEGHLASWLTQRGAAYELPVPPSMRTLSWDEARSLAQMPGAFIGSHADRHEILTQLSAAEQGAVLQRGRDRLERELGVSIEWISPPNGDVDEALLKNLKETGFSAWFGTQTGTFKAVTPAPGSATLVAVDRIGIGRGDTPSALAKRLFAAPSRAI